MISPLRLKYKRRSTLLLILGMAVFISHSVCAQIRIEPETSFPSEGTIYEGDWGNYLLWDNSPSRKLRLGVSNDSYTRAEILLENNNTARGSIFLYLTDSHQKIQGLEEKVRAIENKLTQL